MQKKKEELIESYHKATVFHSSVKALQANVPRGCLPNSAMLNGKLILCFLFLIITQMSPTIPTKVTGIVHRPGGRERHVEDGE